MMMRERQKEVLGALECSTATSRGHYGVTVLVGVEASWLGDFMRKVCYDNLIIPIVDTDPTQSEGSRALE